MSFLSLNVFTITNTKNSTVETLNEVHITDLSYEGLPLSSFSKGDVYGGSCQTRVSTSKKIRVERRSTNIHAKAFQLPRITISAFKTDI
jgi:hypothetical protein